MPLRADRTVEGFAQLGVQGQYGRQGSVAFDQGVQGIGVQRQLRMPACGIVHQGLLSGTVHGPAGGQRGTRKNQQGMECQTQGTGDRRHAGNNGLGRGRNDNTPVAVLT